MELTTKKQILKTIMRKGDEYENRERRFRLWPD